MYYIFIINKLLYHIIFILYLRYLIRVINDLIYLIHSCEEFIINSGFYFQRDITLIMTNVN